MKHGTTLTFDGGSIQLRLTGWEGHDGWATLRFDQDAIEARPNEHNTGASFCFDMPPSELEELRAFLNRHAPSHKSPDR